MGSIRKTSAGRYQARFRDLDNRSRGKTFDRKTDASRFLAAVETDKARGDWIDPRLGKTPFDEWAKRWQEGRVNLRPSTLASEESFLRLHVIPGFASAPLAKITPLDVEAWLASLTSKGLSPKSVRHAYRILKSILSKASDARLIARSPCIGSIELPRSEKVEQRYLDPVEVERLAGSLDPFYRPLVYSAVYLGCRWGELVGLRRENLNMLKREARIIGTLEEVNGTLRYVHETKTATSRRTVSVPRFLVDFLAAHLAAAPKSEFVFTTKSGKPIWRANFRTSYWLPAVTASGLEPLRFHDLRHTCASILIAEGAHPKEIQARLGHASITTTLDRYGHLFPSLDELLGERLDRVQAKARVDAEATKRPQLNAESGVITDING